MKSFFKKEILFTSMRNIKKMNFNQDIHAFDTFSK